MESDCDSFGDLGLGRGLKPGAVWRNYESDPERECERTAAAAGGGGGKCWSAIEAVSCRSLSLGFSSGRRRTSLQDDAAALALKTNPPLKCWSKSDEYRTTNIPDKLREGRLKQEDEEIGTELTPNSSANNFCDSVITAKQRRLTDQGIEELKQDLELCEMQLSAKYQATKILQEQLTTAKREKEILSNRSENFNKRLIQELNRVQFELKCHEGKLLDSQEKWSSKFDRYGRHCHIDKEKLVTGSAEFQEELLIAHFCGAFVLSFTNRENNYLNYKCAKL